MNIKRLKTLFFLIFITSCGSGGGGASSDSSSNNPTNTIRENYIPDCSSPKRGEHPFHDIGYQNGTEYFLICSADQLASIDGSYLDDYFIQGADIDLFPFYQGDYRTNIINQFFIGKNSQNPFSGTYIGNSWSISNFRYITTNEEYCGLFGYTLNADIQLVQLENSRISANNESKCGVIAGQAVNSSFKEIAVTTEDDDSILSSELHFSEGSNISGFIASINDTSVIDSYSVIDLNINDNSANNYLAGGLFLEVQGSSTLKNLFYDGNYSEIVMVSSKGSLSALEPVVSENKSLLIENLYFSENKGFSAICNNSVNCDVYDIIQINASGQNELYFYDSRNSPLSDWNPVFWWFVDENDDPRYPWLE